MILILPKQKTDPAGFTIFMGITFLIQMDEIAQKDSKRLYLRWSRIPLFASQGFGLVCTHHERFIKIDFWRG